MWYHQAICPSKTSPKAITNLEGHVLNCQCVSKVPLMWCYCAHGAPVVLMVILGSHYIFPQTITLLSIPP